MTRDEAQPTEPTIEDYLRAAKRLAGPAFYPFLGVDVREDGAYVTGRLWVPVTLARENARQTR